MSLSRALKMATMAATSAFILSSGSVEAKGPRTAPHARTKKMQKNLHEQVLTCMDSIRQFSLEFETFDKSGKTLWQVDTTPTNEGGYSIRGQNTHETKSHGEERETFEDGYFKGADGEIDQYEYLRPKPLGHTGNLTLTSVLTYGPRKLSPCPTVSKVVAQARYKIFLEKILGQCQQVRKVMSQRVWGYTPPDPSKTID